MNTEEHQETQSEVTEQSSEPVVTSIENKSKLAPGAVTLMLIALTCLVTVLYFIFSLWLMPYTDSTLVVEESPTDMAESLEAEDPTNVPDRDPEVLGLRIDTVLGRFLTERATGNTLYVNSGECVDECLNDWTPYLADRAVVDGGDLGTVERTDSGEYQYTWNGQALYTFNADDERSVLGDGYGGTWRIARP